MSVIVAAPNRRFTPRSFSSSSRRAESARFVPEWRTEAWAHRVEAEARHRLRDEIRGVARAH